MDIWRAEQLGHFEALHRGTDTSLVKIASADTGMASEIGVFACWVASPDAQVLQIRLDRCSQVLSEDDAAHCCSLF